MVENEGFKDFVKLLNPSYTLPSRQSLLKTSLPLAYEKCLNDMKQQIKENVLSVCLTTDCWTSINNQSFIAITSHYLDNDFKFKSVLLECVPFEETHTSINLGNKIKSVITEWELEDKFVLVVSDNAYNIKGAITILGLKHFVCYAHSLNLIVQDALKITSISNLIDKIKSIVGHFKRSSNASRELDKYQINSGTVPKKLIQHIPTRWNSTYFMLCRFIELENAIKATLAILDTYLSTLSPDEWIMCKELSVVLKPFEEVTKTVSGENYMSASLIIILTNGLQSVTERTSTNNFNINIKQVIFELKNGLTKIFSNLEQSNTLTVCTFLDPRFKHYPLNDNIASETKTKVINVTAQIAKNKTNKVPDQIATTINSTYVQSDEFCIWNNLTQKHLILHHKDPIHVKALLR